MDVLVPTSMKNAAKCDKCRDLQDLVNHQNFERKLCFWIFFWKHACMSVSKHHLTCVKTTWSDFGSAPLALLFVSCSRLTYLFASNADNE